MALEFLHILYLIGAIASPCTETPPATAAPQPPPPHPRPYVSGRDGFRV